MAFTQSIPSMEEDRATMDRIYAAPAPALLRQLEGARGDGLTTSQAMREIVKLAIGPGRLKPQEYFYYRLFDPSLTFEIRRPRGDVALGEQSRENGTERERVSFDRFEDEPRESRGQLWRRQPSPSSALACCFLCSALRHSRNRPLVTRRRPASPERNRSTATCTAP